MFVTTLVVGYILFLLTRRYIYRPQRKAVLLVCCMLVGGIVDAATVSRDLLRHVHVKAQAQLASYGPVR